MGSADGIGGPVIVTDALLRKSLAAVRSLGSRGIPVFAAETTRLTPAGMSKYCAASLRSPSPAASPEAFAGWMADQIRSRPGAMAFPMDDHSTGALLRHSDRLPSGGLSLLPSLESFEAASDKFATVRKAEAAGIECPLTWLPGSEAELADIAADFPLVVKPRRSSGSRGIRIVNDLSSLREAYREASAGGEPPMIQQYIPPGDRYDAAVLLDADGEPAATFAQREIRHYPADIGPSTAQISVHMPELIEMAVKLLQSMNWRGIAEVEWMRDPTDGRLKLMEINPRYWNSLHLAIQSGIDFPYLHYRLSLGERVTAVHEYKIGQMTRNLLPGDVLHALSTRRLIGLHPPLLGKAGLPVEDDILSWRDPGAAVGFACACTRFVFDKKMWAAVFKR